MMRWLLLATLVAQAGAWGCGQEVEDLESALKGEKKKFKVLERERNAERERSAQEKLKLQKSVQDLERQYDLQSTGRLQEVEGLKSALEGEKKRFKVLERENGKLTGRLDSCTKERDAERERSAQKKLELADRGRQIEGLTSRLDQCNTEVTAAGRERDADRETSAQEKLELQRQIEGLTSRLDQCNTEVTAAASATGSCTREWEADRQRSAQEQSTLEFKQRWWALALIGVCGYAAYLIWNNMRLNKPAVRKAQENTRAMPYTDGQKKLTEVYDYVLKYENFTDICSEEGAKLSVSSQPLLEEPIPSTIVSIMGVFNKGKTTLMSMLTGVQFPTGDEFRTPGLCGKLADLQSEEKILVLDTAGTDSPNLKDSSSEGVQIKNAEEEFLQHISFSLSTIYIFVVERMTTRDVKVLQRYCTMIADSAKRSTSFKKRKVFIVHNMRMIDDLDLLDKHFEAEVRKYSVGGQEFKPRSEPITLSGGFWSGSFWSGKQRNVKHLKGEMCDVEQTHVVLGKIGSDADKQNPFVIEFLRKEIRSAFFASENESLPKEVVKCCNEIVGDFFQCSDADQKMIFQYNKTTEKLNIATKKGTVSVKYRYLLESERLISSRWVPPYRLYTCQGSNYAKLLVEVPGCSDGDGGGQCHVEIYRAVRDNRDRGSSIRGGEIPMLDVHVYKEVPHRLAEMPPAGKGAAGSHGTIAHKLSSGFQLAMPWAWGIYEKGVQDGVFYACFVNVMSRVKEVQAAIKNPVEEYGKLTSEGSTEGLAAEPAPPPSGLQVDIKPSAPHLDPLGILARPEDHRAAAADAEVPPSESSVPDFFEKPAGTMPGDQVSYGRQ